MRLGFTPEEDAFRAQLRSFLRREIPAEIRGKVSAGQPLSKDEYVTAHRILNANGLAVPHWPKEWGGQEWTAVERFIHAEELQLAAVPPPLPFNCSMVGPVIAKFGSDEQKQRFLRKTANLDIWWCQGFSEPGAGSDLASLKTRAVRDGEYYVVDGQKAWTTYAHFADWIFCLVRTHADARKQAGISFLLMDLKSPGVTVRPVTTLDGYHEVNEIFFDSVRVPLANLVGAEDEGWTYAKYLLANERVGIARTGMTVERIERIKRLARQTPAGTGTMWDQQDFRRRLASLEIELKALEITQMRVLSRSSSADGRPDPASSILKIKGSELQQTATELLLELAGPGALAAARDAAAQGELSWAESAAPFYFNNRKVTIYGGSNEIQRNVIAKAILGL